ncbi:unnamed protein product [Soboliphyme baturini]|uniref:Uncharacterized protein n=1 Tax=Soboliphyme baturini TaxID=241478 RepID=A0A3P8AKQ2_9BILA|nr:unnamed protein product [Soboliphyme baturini]
MILDKLQHSLLSWDNVFCPKSADEFAFNRNTALEFQRWLEYWRNKLDRKTYDDVVETEVKKRKGISKYEDDEDWIEIDTGAKIPNVAIVYGEAGCGKTSLVHVLAKYCGIKPPATHRIDAIENHTGSVVARVTGPCRLLGDCCSSAIRTCSLPSASRRRSCTTTSDEDRRNDDEDTGHQRSGYPLSTEEADSAMPL